MARGGGGEGGIPSTGKSSNSSSSSSCAAFCGWRGLVVSLESETVALVVAVEPVDAPDMVVGFERC